MAPRTTRGWMQQTAAAQRTLSTSSQRKGSRRGRGEAEGRERGGRGEGEGRERSGRRRGRVGEGHTS